MSATDQKQKLGGHTQLFGEQLVTLKDLHEFKNELLLEVKKSFPGFVWLIAAGFKLPRTKPVNN